MENVEVTRASHVVMLPQQAQGHVKPMLNLAELLCLANVKVTFLVTAQIHDSLVQHTDTVGRFGRYPNLFEFKVVPDVPPCRQWATYDHLQIMDSMIQGLAVYAKPLLQHLFSRHGNCNGNGNGNDEMSTGVTCLIADGWYSFAYDVANEAGIPYILCCCVGVSWLWSNFCIPALVDAGQLPFQDEDLDELVHRNVPGMETFLRYRDLPSFCRTKDKDACERLQRNCATEAERIKEAYGLILNTFEELDGPVISLLEAQCKRVYSIGPFDALVKHISPPQSNATLISPSAGSLREADQSCLSWLYQKPPKSVVYVGFGSIAVFKRDQLMEIWEGLVESNKYFLWAIRPDLISSKDASEALVQGTKERGYIVSWAPQEAVLAHPAIGGFLTHSGWNSTLESLIAGVPMICLPYFGDQQINSRYVAEVWKVGLDMKDIYDRNVVAEMVNDLLDGKKDEVQKSMARMSDAAKKSVVEGGSSYRNFDSLIQDIKMMSFKGEHSLQGLSLPPY
ncbi:hypothetical protein RND81_03G214800 [Saponaria officinalis]|uniref:Glycosyltransferase n=1 Tax=Saponaria officinalis TaxID=3572 RepID=A0AAW1M1U1_SAPOF